MIAPILRFHAVAAVGDCADADADADADGVVAALDGLIEVPRWADGALVAEDNDACPVKANGAITGDPASRLELAGFRAVAWYTPRLYLFQRMGRLDPQTVRAAGVPWAPGMLDIRLQDPDTRDQRMILKPAPGGAFVPVLAQENGRRIKGAELERKRALPDHFSDQEKTAQRRLHLFEQAAGMVALGLRYLWVVEMRRNGLPGLKFATTPAGALEAFRLREIPEGRRTRPGLLHWVKTHRRATSDVREHLRGASEFTHAGMHCRIVPSAFDAERSLRKELRKRAEAAE